MPMENFTPLVFSSEDLEQMEFLQMWNENEKKQKEFRKNLLSEKKIFQWILTFLPFYKWNL